MEIIYVLLAISFSLSVVSGAFLLLKQKSKLRGPFIFLLICIAIWSIGYMFEIAETTLEEKLFWAKFEYFGIATIFLPWLILVLKYAGKMRYINRKSILLLSIEPLLTILLAWTNEYHYLIWDKFYVEKYKALNLLMVEYGPWAKIHTIYVYLILSFTLLILLQIIAHSYYIYKKQAIILFIASLIPFASHISYAIRLSKFDITPFAFLISSIAFAYLFKAGKLDILPVAKENIIESMKEGIIAIDKNRRILYVNPSGAKIIGMNGNEIVGKNVDFLKELYPEIFEREKIKEVKIDGRYYEIDFSPLYGEYGEKIGSLIIFDDITERKMAEKKLQEALNLEKEIKVRMAHFFFNPIAIAKGFLMLAIEDGTNGKVKKAMKAIERIEKVVKNIVTKGEIKE